ncbi:MAG: hypothetical protein Q4F02_01070 [Candidatus Saccharibacteria bacterium]|nr:hypothetical protein [Candidatus Saccharibacteria bacterium]
MKVYLPNSAYIGNIDGFLRHLDTGSPDELSITTHDKWINVHPGVLALVARLGMGLSPSHIHFDNITATSGHYLERMGLFRLLGVDSPYTITEHEAAGRFVPLTVVKTQEDQTRFITDMIPLLHLAPEQADAIRYVVGELLRNVLEHARSPLGGIVAAQYYQKTNMVRVGICDGGIGVRRSLSRAWSTAHDAEALSLALTPGITGTTRREGGSEVNAGAGLFFIKSMALVGRSYFMLYSGQAMYKLHLRRPTKRFPTIHSDPLRDRHALRDDVPLLDGTLVAVDIALDQTLHFQELLRTIRAAYTQTVRERRERRYKRPQFITGDNL